MTRGHDLRCQPQTRAPLPPPPHFGQLRSLGTRPLGPHTLPPPFPALPGRPGRPSEAVRGGKGQPHSRRRGERLVTPGSPGIPGSWRRRGLQPFALGTSLPATAMSPGERLWLLSGGAGSLIPGGKLGQPRRPGRRICQAAGTSVPRRGLGARAELLVLVRSQQHLLSPWRPRSRQDQPDHRAGQPSQGHVMLRARLGNTSSHRGRRPLAQPVHSPLNSRTLGVGGLEGKGGVVI